MSIAKKVDNRGTKQGEADPTMGKQYKYFFPDAESLVTGRAGTFYSNRFLQLTFIEPQGTDMVSS